MEDRPVRWVELYAGTGACGYELLAGAKFPTSYQGSSRALAQPTLAAVGLADRPARVQVVLNDLAPISRVHSAVRRDSGAVAELVADMAPGEEGWRAVAEAPVPEGELPFAAAYLALLSATVLSKPPVVAPGGRAWRTAGYARLSPSARRRGFRIRFNPTALARKIERLGAALPSGPAVEVLSMDAMEVPVVVPDGSRTIVYIDPPHRKTTGYSVAPTPSRRDVVALGERWVRAGASVLLAESEPVPLCGRRAVRLRRTDGRPIPRGRPEWLTVVEGLQVS
jgi:16S rRNA G966 N2-methylase RsmD